jgi:phosphatidylserine decarboxylase
MISDGYRFFLPLAAAAAAVCFFSLVAGIPLLVLAAFVGYFFRNPARRIPARENLVVSPADGKVVKISRVPGDGHDCGRIAVSIFLNIFNVHVTRAPIHGTVQSVTYQRGRFKVAFDEEASRVNEQNIITIRNERIELVVKQIAGLIARRVICWKKSGEVLARGELFGLIRFGSRVDLLLPHHVHLLVKVGDRVRGGSSVIGDYNDS